MNSGSRAERGVPKRGNGRLRELAAAPDLDNVRAQLDKRGFEAVKARWSVFQITKAEDLYLLKSAAQRTIGRTRSQFG